MATYTMQLRTYIEKFSQFEHDLSIDERIEKARGKLFDFHYPFFDESYRKQFETNIINEFYMREIGFETEELFKMRLRNWLMKNMGYYNKLFESELIKYNPLTNSEMNVTHTKENDKEQQDLRNVDQSSNTHGTGNTESEQVGNVDSQQKSNVDNKQETKRDTDAKENQFDRNIESDTPQDRLRLSTKDGSGIIEYATKINENKMNNDANTKENEDMKGSSKTDSTGNRQDKTDFQSQDETNVDSTAEQKDEFNSEANELEKFTQNRVGKIGVQSYAKLVQDYRQALLRVEVQIHDEMQELFMLVY